MVGGRLPPAPPGVLLLVDFVQFYLIIEFREGYLTDLFQRISSGGLFLFLSRDFLGNKA
ncbi:hypothetical protein KL86PLE_90297 [uncultured Pleomorphomonas sp.]|uniref:Uncharacterized protein n=1 Tax=uncultured Pleomorphomonas sp. TaxID=442121 RepID=A0A212LNX6_9HYPH|nr:hypothetical protein KL86PLE_90297 [uncultured Pleomorphomonas sp.]